ncbi:uncharacterized protein [Narcine bancroftii]|uniref:uncharacterized protein isoform X2 n=1 Tax=Narcine bancroftii TaxID=1343680 RepID=UPI0038321DEA
MDEVWLVSLCLTFLAFVIALLSLRKADNEAEGSAKAKERSAEPAFASVQPAPRFMEMTLEDIGKSLERLGAVLGAEVETQSGAEVPGAPGSKARAFAVKALPVPKAELVNQHFDTEEWEFEDEEEMDALQHEGAEKQYYHLYWDNESLPDRSNYSVVEKTDLTKRKVKIEPSTQAESQKHGGREGIEIMEHPPVTSSTRNIMEQIEQAVQETPDHNRARSEYIRVRRAPPAPRFETPPRDDVPQSRSLHSSD